MSDPGSITLLPHIAGDDRPIMRRQRCVVGLSIASDLRFVEVAEQVTTILAHQVGFDDDAALWISMAIREAVINAIRHGNKEDRSKCVDIQYTLNHDSLAVRVSDRGEGFDPATAPNPLDPENLLKPSGRGIFYMKTFMDEVRYSPRPGGGTVVWLTKKIKQPESKNVRH